MPDMRALPIGVFDSGLGGLTVAREIMRTLPEESLVYLGDSARCPYGPRDRSDVREFVLEIGSWLAKRPVKLIVIACNTATAAGLPLAQRVFDVPVIGVVEPGARAAVQATVNRRVGVIATVGTVESGAYSRAVRALDAGVTVFSAAAPRFVDVVEAGLRMDDSPIEEWMSHTADVFIRPSFYEISRDYLDPLKRAGIDTLVLGCTHFPLLSPAIQQVVGPQVRLISSAEETAREVAETLAARGQLAERSGAPVREFHTTGDATEFENLGSRILGVPTGPVGTVGVETLSSRVDDSIRAAAAAFAAEEEACD
ncbi:MAG: glutamate racemase [Actinobacteria bacterium HGW-Actinobacteria-1]|nr:MAG: glutamate racemase [Actinobacteria bacterium HGW-Actinobacteria-1]